MSKAAGLYDLRIVVLTRELVDQADNGEEVETWPEPAAGENEYFAATDSLSAGETIAQGIRQSEGSMKLRIKGRSIPLSDADRIRKKVTGEVYAVRGMYRDKTDTVFMADRVHQQATGR